MSRYDDNFRYSHNGSEQPVGTHEQAAIFAAAAAARRRGRHASSAEEGKEVRWVTRRRKQEYRK